MRSAHPLIPTFCSRCENRRNTELFLKLASIVYLLQFESDNDGIGAVIIIIGARVRDALCSLALMSAVFVGARTELLTGRHLISLVAAAKWVYWIAAAYHQRC